jgi:hypothetical protein
MPSVSQLSRSDALWSSYSQPSAAVHWTVKSPEGFLTTERRFSPLAIPEISAKNGRTSLGSFDKLRGGDLLHPK